MAGFRRFCSRLLHSLWPGRDEGLDREVASHLSFLEDEYRRQGLSPDAARRAARLALGGVEQTKESYRAARAFSWIDNARRDVAYAVRMLKRHPIATAAATLSLALGIGLNAAVFSVVDWVLLRPFPYPAPHELVRVLSAGTDPVTSATALTHAEFERYRASTAFRQSAAFTAVTRVLAGPGIEPVHTVVARTSGDLFGTLGVFPERGRAFSPEEIAAGAPVVVLSRELWQRSFAGDRSGVGRVVTIDGAAHTVVGVLPPGRGYPREAEIWRPSTVEEREDDDRELSMVGRLRDGTTAARASTEIGMLEHSASKGARTAWADDLQRTDVGDVRAALQALLAATLLVLVIACANVAALLAARGADRVGEMAVRSALGATRARLVTQMITESLVLAAAGGAMGLALGHWTIGLLVAIAPLNIPRIAEIALDTRIFIVGVAATLLTGAAVGVIPAFRVSRLVGSAKLHAGWNRISRRSIGRRALVLAQITIAVVLTTGAGLFARSLHYLVTIDHGFAPDQLIAVDLYLRGGFSGDAQQLFRELIERARTAPGVRAAAVAMRLPTQVAGVRTQVRLVGEPRPAAPAVLRPVSPQYFDTVRIPLVAGRAFAASDSRSAPRVAIVNNAFVRETLGGRTAIGSRLTVSLIQAPVTIVGVAGDVKPAGEPDRPAVYVPLDQLPIGGGYLIAAAQGDPRSIVPSITDRLRPAAPGLALDRVRRVAESLEDSRAVTRFITQLALLFAALALLLSAVGVYGLVAGDVTARWREIAIRLALGASEQEALWTVLRPSVVILAIGATLGFTGALGAGPALASLLHGVSPVDGQTIIGAPAFLVAIGIVAALFAAARVLRSNPATTLRNE